MPATPLRIPSDGIALEGWLHTPPGDGPFAVAVVCHPHPLYGGSMHNNVVDAAVSGLNARGLAAIRFNFRGVGGSGGTHSGGAGEQADVRAALRHAGTIAALDAQRVALAGYSFGAMMAAAVAEPSIPALALVALPLARVEDALDALVAYPHPLLFVAGDRDQACAPDALRAFVERLHGHAEVSVVPGADHFFGGCEPAVEEAIGVFFAKALTPPAAYVTRPDGRG